MRVCLVVCVRTLLRCAVMCCAVLPGGVVQV